MSISAQRAMILRWEQEWFDRIHKCGQSGDAIGEEAFSRSPLLLRFSAQALYDEGRLEQSRRTLEQALKRLAELYLPEELLAAMALLAEVYWRIGLQSATTTLLDFIAAELERAAPGDRSGAAARTLAVCGSGPNRHLMFEEAIEWFEREGRFEWAGRATAEMILFIGEQLAEEDWAMLQWRLRRWQTMFDGTSFLIALVPAWRMFLQGRHDMAGKMLGDALQLLQEGALPYYVRASVETAKMRCAAGGDETEWRQAYNGVAAIRAVCAQDLRLQLELLQAMRLSLEARGLYGEAAELMKECSWVSRTLGLPANVEPASETRCVAAALQQDGIAEHTGWKIGLFGGLQFSKGGRQARDLRWSRRKAQELLLLLLFQPNYSSPKELVMEELQLQDDGAKAQQTLYMLVHYLKKWLLAHLAIADGVVIKNGLVCLRADALEEVDAERYLVLNRVAGRLWERDRDMAFALYREAFELYDRLLPELPYILWLEARRSQMARVHATLLRRCAAYAEQTGRAEEAEMYLREWIGLDTSDEAPFEQLAALMRRSGRDAEAVRLLRHWEEWGEGRDETTRPH